MRTSSSYWEHLKELSKMLQKADERPLWKRGPPPIRMRAAARRIGQETVRYVRDIYKYYVAYRLELDLERERERQKKDATVDEAQAHETP